MMSIGGIMDYEAFLKSKALTVQPAGFEVDLEAINEVLFPFQKLIVRWAVRKGRCAIFADVGLGKTVMQLEWARLINQRTLIVAPLAVTHQTIREAKRLLNMDVRYIRDSADVNDDCQFYITNYEMLDHFDASLFGAVVLDESSILKNMTGVTKKKLVSMFAETPYRLACTATPAPNDVTELGSHADFLGVMTNAQMTSVFFVHEAGVFQGIQESRWRLKQHAERDFYRWLASWSVAIKKPSDLGFSDEGYDLPELNIRLITVDSDYTPPGMLPGFNANGISATDASRVRRTSIPDRAIKAAELINGSDNQWIVWTGLNDEADTLAQTLTESVNVYGSMGVEEKIDALLGFVETKTRVLITKTSIAGLGINMQQCSRMLFFGIDFSWESFYQAIGRIYRFGQKAECVEIVVLISEQERAVYDAIERKAKVAESMTQSLIAECSIYSEVKNVATDEMNYTEATEVSERWTLMLGDSCQRMAEIPDDSVHISVYSPPFSDMYIYNNTPLDLSNSLDLPQFFEHYAYIIRENLRITLPGRIACVHVQDPKTFKNRDGYRGLRDFTGMVISAYIQEGWIYRSCITIDKNPQIVATRNKDTDLLFVTGKRDSADLAPMATDYLLVFKKPGDNPIPVTPYNNGEMEENDWISWAHAVWYGIRETDVLNVAVAREDADEKHMCPLQLPLIERCLKLWSNPGELVFSPFAGIGSELYSAVKLNRRGLGIELKPSYWAQAIRNVKAAERASAQINLFSYAEAQEALS